MRSPRCSPGGSARADRLSRLYPSVRHELVGLGPTAVLSSGKGEETDRGGPIQAQPRPWQRVAVDTPAASLDPLFAIVSWWRVSRRSSGKKPRFCSVSTWFFPLLSHNRENVTKPLKRPRESCRSSNMTAEEKSGCRYPNRVRRIGVVQALLESSASASASDSRTDRIAARSAPPAGSSDVCGRLTGTRLRSSDSSFCTPLIV